MAIVNSIIRASEVLKALGDGPSTITSLSGRLGLSGSTLHRLLKSLEGAGFVVQEPLTKQYGLGPLIPALSANSNISHFSLISSAQAEMEKLRQITGETIGLVIRMGYHRVQLEELQSHQALKYSVGRGFVAPIYSGATGKVILSKMNDSDVEKLLKQVKLIKVGPATITNKHALFKEIERVREKGYACSISEIVDGAASLAVPVNGYVFPVAMCILAPASRFANQFNDHIELCLKSAKIIEGKLKRLL